MRRRRLFWFLRHPLRWRFVPRRVMPQVSRSDYTALLEWLAWRGVRVEDTTLDPTTIRFAQRVDMNRVLAMNPEEYDRPVWVSSDSYALDGNHRCTAHVIKRESVRALRIDLPFQEAVGALFSFAGTYDYAGERRVKR